MYDEIRFYHDENGKALRDEEGKSKPRILTPDMCYAKGFTVSVHAGDRTGAPCLRVERIPGPLSKDGWNDDGRPPTVMFMIDFAHVTMMDGVITAVGFENPNLSIAGLPSEAYSEMGFRKKTPNHDLIRLRRTSMDDHPWTPISDYCEVYPQKVTLLSKRK